MIEGREGHHNSKVLATYLIDRHALLFNGPGLTHCPLEEQTSATFRDTIILLQHPGHF